MRNIKLENLVELTYPNSGTIKEQMSARVELARRAFLENDDEARGVIGQVILNGRKRTVASFKF